MHRRSLLEADNNREDDDKGIGGSIIHYMCATIAVALRYYFSFFA